PTGACGLQSLPEVHHRLEPAVDHPRAVEGHRIDLRVHPRVTTVHHLLHAGVAGRLVGPLDPREHDRLVFLALHGAAEVGLLAVGHVVAPALDHAGGAVLDEHRVAGVGVVDELLLVGGGYGDDESIDVGHGGSPVRWVPGYDGRRRAESTACWRYCGVGGGYGCCCSSRARWTALLARVLVVDAVFSGVSSRSL